MRSEKRQAFRPDGAHRARGLDGEADAVVERSTVFVGAAIAERREEFVGQVAVREVNSTIWESGGEGALGGRQRRLAAAPQFRRP